MSLHKLPGSGAPLEAALDQTCSHKSTASTKTAPWKDCRCEIKVYMRRFGTGHRAVEVGAAARQFLQRLPALVSAQTQRGGQRGGGGGEEVSLGRGLTLDHTATAARRETRHGGNSFTG